MHVNAMIYISSCQLMPVVNGYKSDCHSINVITTDLLYSSNMMIIKLDGDKFQTLHENHDHKLNFSRVS